MRASQANSPWKAAVYAAKCWRTEESSEHRTQSRQSGIEKLGLPRNNHAPAASKLEVRRCSPRVNLADQLAGEIPDVDAVSTTSVHATLRIGMDACHTYELANCIDHNIRSDPKKKGK